MKTNSCNKATTFTVVAAAVALVVASWPAIGRSQSQARRDRSRRDTGQQDSAKFKGARPDASGRPDSSKAQDARPGTSDKTGRITGPVAPDAAAKLADRRSSQPTQRPPARRAVQDEQWTKFDIILTRNVFSRQRIPARAVGIVEPPKVMPNPESYFLLRGVSQEYGQFIAFVEDKQGGSVLRLHHGDHVARGTIKSLNLDVLEYQLGDKTTAVSLGLDLEGGHGAITASDLASLPQTAAPAAPGQSAGAPAAPSANEAEILKRLMEQRKQQIGQ
jgi:hypothetical protein